MPEQTEIVGVRHHESELERSLTRNERRADEVPITVELRADPDNPKDGRAIAAYHRGEHIGFIAKGETGIFHPQFSALGRGEVLVVGAVQVVRGGKRYVRVYSHAELVAVEVGVPGPRLSIGSIRGQSVDEGAAAEWLERHGHGAAVATGVAQLAVHPFSAVDAVIHLDGVPVAVLPKSNREQVAAEARAAAAVGETLGAPVRVARTQSGAWTVTLQKPVKA